jgi:cation transport ATPase
MNKILQVGDSICSPLQGYVWVVRSALPGRLRLSNIQLSVNSKLQESLEFAASDSVHVDYIRFNVHAGCIVLVNHGFIPWCFDEVQNIFNSVDYSSQSNSSLVTQNSSNRGALVRVLIAGGLFILNPFLLNVWFLPIFFLLLPPVFLPFLVNLKRDIASRKIPVDSLDLFWLSSLLLRGEYGGFATEIALDNSNQLLQGQISSTTSYGEELSVELQHWQNEATFLLAPPQLGEKHLNDLRSGDRILIAKGGIVPLDGYIVSGSGVVSKHLLDGDSALINVESFQPLPLGVVLVQGEIVLKLTQSLIDQPIYQQLLDLAQHHPEPWGIEKARLLHRQVLPVSLGLAFAALLLGRAHAASALVQFDPFNDWQLSASIAYRGVRKLFAGWGVSLRRGFVLDRLADCHTLVVTEGAICFGLKRAILEMRSLDTDYNVNTLVEMVSGFRRFEFPEAIPLFPLQMFLKEKDLEPRQVDNLISVGGCGLNGNISGLDVYVGGGTLLRHLNIPRPLSMPQIKDRHWLFIVVNSVVVGGLCYEDHLDNDVVRSLQRLRHNGWHLHLVSTWHGDSLDSVARQLQLSPDMVHTALNLNDRMDLIRSFDRTLGPVAFIGSSLVDSGAFAEADIAIAVSDGSFSLPIEMADIILPAKRLDRLIDCAAVSGDIASNNSRNFYLILFPHSAALLLSLLLLLDPLLSVLLADLPLLLIEFSNLSTHKNMKDKHGGGWRSQRKRTSKRRSTNRAPHGDSSSNKLGSG